MTLPRPCAPLAHPRPRRLLAGAIITLGVAFVPSKAFAYTDAELTAIAQHVQRGSVVSESCGTECQQYWDKEQASSSEPLHAELLELRSRVSLMPSLRGLGNFPLDRGDHTFELLVKKRNAPAGARYLKLIRVRTPAPSPPTEDCPASDCTQTMVKIDRGQDLNGGSTTSIVAPSNGYQWYWDGAVGNTWRRLVPGPEPNCNDHPEIPPAFETFTSSQSTWCFVGKQQQVGFYPFADLKLAGATVEPADESVPHDRMSTINVISWSFQALKDRLDTELASGDFPALEAFYDFLPGAVPDCRGLAVAACKASLKTAGFSKHSVIVAAGSGIDIEVPPDRVVLTSPPAGTDVAHSSPITITVNPARVAYEDELLRRFTPELRYDNDESFHADSPEMLTDWPENRLRRVNGTDVAPPTLDLAFLRDGSYDDGVTVPAWNAELASAGRVDRIDSGDQETLPWASSTTAQGVIASSLRGANPTRYANKTYGRVVTSGGQTWLQYWLYYYHNPSPPGAFGFGEHEGDWELVQVGLSGAVGDFLLKPTTAAGAAHESGYSCDWEDLEQNSNGQLVVYPAVDSHASYFHPGTYDIGGLGFATDDTVEGDGEFVTPAVVRVDGSEGWLRWPGMWGGTTFSAGLGGAHQRSPEGPQYQSGEKWDNPSQWAGNLREDGCAASAVAAKSPPAPPSSVEMDASRAASLVRVNYSVAPAVGTLPRALRVSVDRDDPRSLPITSFVPVRGRGDLSGAIEFPEPPGEGSISARLSFYDRAGRLREGPTIPVSP